MLGVAQPFGLATPPFIIEPLFFGGTVYFYLPAIGDLGSHITFISSPGADGSNPSPAATSEQALSKPGRPGPHSVL